MRQNNGRSNTWLSWRRWGRSGFSNEWNDGCFVHAFVIWRLTALWFVIEGTLYYMRPSMGERGETLHFSIPSINQSRSFGSIFLALATPSTMVPMMPKAIFTFGYTLWMPLTVPLGLLLCAIYTNLNYIDLKNYRIKISKKEVILPRG